jgi:sarcosine oxidase subunit beta
VREVAPDDIFKLNPALNTGDIIGGSYCPTDGFIRPMNILTGYMEAARRKGVQFEFGVECAGCELTGGRLTQLHTSRGRIAVNRVVNAAGAWAGGIAQMTKSEISVSPLRRQVAVVKEEGRLPEEMPMSIFLEDGFHFRVRDGKVLLLKPTEVPSSFDIIVEEPWISEVEELAHRRVRPLADITVDRSLCWAGLYEMTPDKHAVLGVPDECENFYCVNGSSGHGVMHAPALGQLLSEIIVHGSAQTLDVRALRPSRFREGKPNPPGEFL